MNPSDERIRDLKRIILRTAYETHEGHIPSAFSILDMLYVLYHSILKIDPHKPDMKDRDYLIVSTEPADGVKIIRKVCTCVGWIISKFLPRAVHVHFP